MGYGASVVRRASWLKRQGMEGGLQASRGRGRKEDCRG